MAKLTLPQAKVFLRKSWWQWAKQRHASDHEGYERDRKTLRRIDTARTWGALADAVQAGASSYLPHVINRDTNP